MANCEKVIQPINAKMDDVAKSIVKPKAKKDTSSTKSTSEKTKEN